MGGTNTGENRPKLNRRQSVDLVSREDVLREFEAYSAACHVHDSILPPREALDHAIQGLVSEAAEVHRLWLRDRYRGGTVWPINYAYELGDVLYEVGHVCRMLHLSFNGIARLNLEKLDGRHGDNPKPVYLRTQGAKA